MYLFLGGETIVNADDLLGIFDLDSTTLSASTRHFLNIAQKENRVVNTSSELPKSFAVQARKNPEVYICQPNVTTLKRRLDVHQFSTNI